MQIKIGSSVGVIILLVLATGSQFLKQSWLAGVFSPGVYAGWATAILASQLLSSFGGLGFHNYSARRAALYESRQKFFLMNSLMSKQYVVYAYLLPISIPIIYYILAKPSFMLFGCMLIYSLGNIFISTSTTAIYVRSSKEFAKIQALRGVGGCFLAVITCYATGSLLLTLLAESLLIIVLGSLILKREKFKFKNNSLRLGLKCNELIPFFLPVVLTTVAVSLSRLIAVDVLNDELLGVFYFMSLIAAVGIMFQYGVAVLVGPIITSQLSARPAHEIENFVLKIWMGIFILALLVLLLGNISLPYIINYFYPNYIAGLVLVSPFVVLCAAKMCDVWGIYFLLGGLERFLYVPSLVSILIVIFLYFYLNNKDGLELADMKFFIFAESIAIFFVPLVLISFLKIKRIVVA